MSSLPLRPFRLTGPFLPSRFGRDKRPATFITRRIGLASIAVMAARANDAANDRAATLATATMVAAPSADDLAVLRAAIETSIAPVASDLVAAVERATTATDKLAVPDARDAANDNPDEAILTAARRTPWA